MIRKIVINLLSLLLMVLSFTLVACKEDKAPIEVVSYPTTKYSGVRLVITAVVDKVTINKVVVNRGNCSPISIRRMPGQLKFGSKESIIVPPGCDKEVLIGTDLGDYTFTFN